MIQWYENGQQMAERTYRRGHANGPAKEWYANGRVRSEEIWKDGKPDDRHAAWFENGQKRLESFYRGGEIVELAMWDETGAPVSIPPLPTPSRR